MAYTPPVRPLGLMPDVNQFDAPDGANTRAEDVIMRRPGVLEPRPGFYDSWSAVWTPPSGYEVRTIVPFDGDHLCLAYNGSAWAWYWLSDGTAVIGLVAGPPDSTERHFGTTQARGSAYVCTDAGVKKFQAGTTISNYDAGLPRARSGFATVSAVGEQWLADTYWVAYRCVWVYTDDNGYEMRSAPSGRWYVRNQAGGARSVSNTFPLWTMDLAGTKIEVYRCLSSATNVLSDEMQLVQVITPTTGARTLGSTTWTDSTPEAGMGATLYTSPGQLGAGQENLRPGIAQDIETFKGSTFYARTKDRPRQLFSLTDVFRFDYRGFGDDFTITANTATGDATMSSISGIAATTDSQLRVGQLVMESGQAWGANGTHIQWPTFVSSINSSSSVELSQTALANGTGITVTFCDTIKIGSNYYVCWSANDLTTSGTIKAVRWNTKAIGVSSTSPADGALAYAINRTETDVCAAILNTEFDRCELLIERQKAWTDVSVTISNGEAWTPNNFVPGTAGSCTTTIEADDTPGRLAWSRADLPEAVPPVNFTIVGDRSQPIYRVAAARDGLWIFKRDGIWRLSGAGADAGWRVDQVSTARLLTPRCVDTFGDDLAAWLDVGVCIVGQGIQPTDAPLADTFSVWAQKLRAFPAPFPGAFIRGNRLESEIYVGVPNASDDNEAGGYVGSIYVFNNATRAWTSWETWNDGVYDLVLSAEDSHLYLAIEGVDWGIRRERINTTFDCADEQYAVTITDNGDGTYTDTVGTWVPVVGDRLYYAVEGGFIGPFVTGVSGTDLTFSSTPNTGAQLAYVAIQSVVEWSIRTGKVPQALKRWTDGELGWEAIWDAYEYTLGFKTDQLRNATTTQLENVELVRNPDATGISGTALDTTAMGYQELPVQFYVPRAACVGSVLRPRLSIRQAGVCFKLAHISLGYEVIGTKLRRQYGA